MARRKVIACGGILCVTLVVVMMVSFKIPTTRVDSVWDTESTTKLVELQQHQPQQHQTQLYTKETVDNKRKQQSTNHKDVIDNSPALYYLTNHGRRFQSIGERPSVKADPNKPETMTTWWQGLAMIDWYMRSPLRHSCKDQVAVGNWFICQDEPFTIKPPCLVYSFGINWEFTFDDAMIKLGCEVHMFDPSMKEKDHRQPNNATFHNMGIGSYNTDAFIPRHDGYVKDRQTWKVRTVKAIMKELGHENRVIDVFKMDVESYEWSVIDNMMETNVLQLIRQFDLEFHLFKDHPLPEEYVHMYQVYTRLRQLGFREYFLNQHKRHVTKREEILLQADVCFVNSFFDYHTTGR